MSGSGERPADRPERSISVFASGSQILIHWDDRFSGTHQCPACDFHPCRVNRYYTGPIEDCKLYRRIDPESLHEIVDYRSDAAQDPYTRPVDGAALGAERSRLAATARRLRREGDFAGAADALQRGVRLESDADGALGLLTVAARLRLRAGDRQAAYRLLASAEDKAAAASDEWVLRRWENVFLSLQEELGGYVGDEARRMRTPAGRILADVFARLRRGPGVDRKECGALISYLEGRLHDLDQEGFDRYRWLSHLASLCQAQGQPERALAVYQRLRRDWAAADEAERLEQEVLDLRLDGYLGRDGDAPLRWPALVPRIEATLDPDRRLEYLGYLLEAVASRSSWAGARGEWVVGLAEEATRLFDGSLAQQPGANARRRLRQRHQRSLEAALLALSAVADAAVPGSRELAQSALSVAWRLTISARNPELRTERAALEDGDTRRLRHLEDSLHRGLNYVLCRGAAHQRQELFEDNLRRVVDFEMTTVADRRAAVAPGDAPTTGWQVAHFLVRDLFSSGRLLVLVRRRSGFEARWIDDARRTVLAPLESWTAWLLSGADDVGRGTRRAADVEGLRHFTVVLPGVGPQRPPDAGRIRALVSALLPVDVDAQAAEDAPDVSVYTDGALLHIPWEMAPRDDVGSPWLASARLRCSLRPLSAAVSDRPLRLRENGWLAVGDAPTAGGFHRLLGTRVELTTIEADLRRSGCETRLLLAEDAHLENLVSRLEEKRPAVLHFAAHGHGDTEYPDGCALVLAMEPGGAAGELLPFRLIRDLPLDGVELVVLSACSTLVGPSGDGTGMEGLAWAFLAAGVPFVLASRCSVWDGPTARLMRDLYRRLLELPVAEAVRSTRLHGLEAAGISTADVAAWCLWE